MNFESFDLMDKLYSYSILSSLSYLHGQRAQSPSSALVRKPKVYPESRVYVTRKGFRLRYIADSRIDAVQVFTQQVNQAGVLLDSAWRDGLGENGPAVRN